MHELPPSITPSLTHLRPLLRRETLAVICRADGGRSALFRVNNVTTERRTGFFNPFTASGTIVVDGVVASVQSKWFADAAMDRLGLTHAIPALYQARLQAPSKLVPDPLAGWHKLDAKSNM